MRIEPIRKESRGTATRYTGRAGGRDLFFELDQSQAVAANNIADSFLLMALAPSMLAGSAIEIEDDSVSPALVENLLRAQEVYSSWNPRYRRVSISARTEPPSIPTPEVITMFSAGVDSMHSLVKHESELTSALMIAGFDMEPDSDQVQQSRERNRKLLESRGKALYFVVSNLRLWGRELGVYRPLAYSGYLAAVALLFGARRVYIPSGFPYGFPTFDGSQPYLDLLWSNGRTQTSQTGAEADRTEKLRIISTDEDLMTALKVCSRSQNENCGKCVKCLRTMVTLRILGVQGPFPRMIDPVEIPRLN